MFKKASKTPLGNSMVLKSQCSGQPMLQSDTFTDGIQGEEKSQWRWGGGLTGDSCATPTDAWGEPGGSQPSPGSSPSGGSAAEPCSRCPAPQARTLTYRGDPGRQGREVSPGWKVPAPSCMAGLPSLGWTDGWLIGWLAECRNGWLWLSQNERF